METSNMDGILEKLKKNPELVPVYNPSSSLENIVDSVLFKPLKNQRKPKKKLSKRVKFKRKRQAAKKARKQNK